MCWIQLQLIFHLGEYQDSGGTDKNAPNAILARFF